MAEQGHEQEQTNLGVVYWLGNGVEKDKSVRWYGKAARPGNGTAMFNLGAADYNGEGIVRMGSLAHAQFLLLREAGNSSGQDAARRLFRPGWQLSLCCPTYRT